MIIILINALVFNFVQENTVFFHMLYSHKYNYTSFCGFSSLLYLIPLPFHSIICLQITVFYGGKTMKIRQALHGDLPRILKLYKDARTFMSKTGNPTQWGNSYPPESIIKSDINSHCCYVCESEDRIIAVFFYSSGPDSTYRIIKDGKWLNDAPYGVVHRIASDGSTRGTASFCLSWAFSQCGNLKIDTHRNNRIMQHLLEKNGFTYCGIIYTPEGSERLAYQKSEI